MKKRTLCFMLFFLLLAASGRLPAQDDHEDPVVYADQKTIGEDALRAAGHVEVYWQDYVIYADAIDFNLKTRELFAEGRVTMAAKEMVLSGEQLVFNLKTQKGELVDAFGLASPVVRFQTDRLLQTDRDTLAFQRLDFSSCAQIAPRWSLSGRKGRIKKAEYIAMSDVVLRLKKVPVFYLPYLRYPLQKDGRATGFLIPALGRSSLRGFFVQNSFFLALKPNIDMTFGLDYFSALGLGASDELRYLFRNASGSARFYYFKYRKDNGVYEGSPDDYYVEADHRQSLPFLNTRLVLKVNRQSRPGFLRLLDSGFDKSGNANFQSSLFLNSSFANMSVGLRVSHEETYTVRTDTTLILDYLPALTFNLNHQKLGKLPGFFSLNAGFNRLRRSGETLDEAVDYATDVFSQRFSVTPSYQLPLFKLPWLSSALNLSSQNAFYSRSYDPETEQIVDEPLYLKYHMAVFTLQGPSFSRVFASGKRKLKHVIEPKFEVRYSTRTEDRERLVRVDGFDKPGFSYAAFSLTTRLLGKSGDSASAGELLSYTISQQYFFDPAEANNDQAINGEFPRFSELRHSVRLRPGGNFDFDGSLEYNHYIHAPARLNLRASYRPPSFPLSGSLSYRVLRVPYRPAEFKGNHSSLVAALSFDAQGFPLKLESTVDYDFTDRRLLHGSLNASFDYQCLVFNAEIKSFSWLGEPYFQFRFGVSLGNLGMVSDFFGGK
ncbi:MAG: LPS assembly protein LptD [Acidobacteria bacterium]|nr:LPS assembly protein LptD [Acidobacteriota bacterium]